MLYAGLLYLAMVNGEGNIIRSEQGVAAKLPELVFDHNDPIASHPDMRELVQSIYERNARRGLTKPATLSTEDKQVILDRHNLVRSQTARGLYEGPNGSNQPKACNMNALSWSAALEKLATDWSGRCYFEHSTGCSSRMASVIAAGTAVEWNRQSNDGCGENLYVSGADPAMNAIYGSGTSQKNYGLMGFEDGWCKDESLLYTYSNQFNYNAGHYTQVVWANTRYVGCGFSQCSGVSTDSSGSWDWAKTMFTCNYFPPGNYGGQYPYQQGEPCSCCDSDRKACTHDGGLCGGGFNSNYNNGAFSGDASEVDRCMDGVGRNVCQENGQTPAPTAANRTPAPTSQQLPPSRPATKMPTGVPTPSPSRIPTPLPTGNPTITRNTAPPAASTGTKYAVQITTDVTWYSFGDNYGDVESSIDELIFNTLAAPQLDLTSSGIDDDNKQIWGPYCAQNQNGACRYYYGFYNAPMVLQGVNEAYKDELYAKVSDGSYASGLCEDLTSKYYAIDGDLGVRCYQVQGEYEELTQSDYNAFIGDMDSDGVPFDTLNLETYKAADIFVLLMFLGILCCACWCVGWYSHKKRFQQQLERELSLAANYNPREREQELRKQMNANQSPDIFEQGVYKFRKN